MKYRRLKFELDIPYYQDFTDIFNNWLNNISPRGEVINITKLGDDKYEIWVKES
jgi:hypothetical protein